MLCNGRHYNGDHRNEKGILEKKKSFYLSNSPSSVICIFEREKIAFYFLSSVSWEKNQKRKFKCTLRQKDLGLKVPRST